MFVIMKKIKMLFFILVSLTLVHCISSDEQVRSPDGTSKASDFDFDREIASRDIDSIEVKKSGTIEVSWKQYKHGSPYSVGVEVFIKCKNMDKKRSHWKKSVCSYDGYNVNDKNPNLVEIQVSLQKGQNGDGTFNPDEAECNDPQTLDINMALECI